MVSLSLRVLYIVVQEWHSIISVVGIDRQRQPSGFANERKVKQRPTCVIASSVELRVDPLNEI